MSAHHFRLPQDILDHETFYTTPHGDMWQVQAQHILDDAPIDHVRYMLRPLAQGNPLALGALLRHVSQFEHPRLYSPSLWTQHEGQFWTGTLTPLGKPLAHADMEPMQWGEAVALWQPLAQAVARAHQRGIIHGQLTPWNVWYDPEAQTLTAVDVGTWLGDDLTREELGGWIAPEFRGPVHTRHPSNIVDIWGLARLLLYLVHPSLIDSLDIGVLPPFAQGAMERALEESPAKRLPRLDELISATSPALLEQYDLRLQDTSNEEITSVLSARISSREHFKHPKLGRGLKFHLNLPSPNEDGQDQLGAFFYHSVDSSLYHSVRWAWNGAQIHLLDARVITNSQNQRFVTSHDQTLPVVEPTFPIAVSNVLKAERCTSRFLVDERDGGSSSRSLVLGNLVHGLLEDLTLPVPLTFEQAFGIRIKGLHLDMLAAGLGDEDLPKLRRDAQQHFENLSKFTDAQSPSDPSPAKTSHSVYSAPVDGTWSGRHIEATRYSPRYGLEGRIDLATEDDKKGIQIIELKSGSAWDGHLSQVRCYTLLWDGLARQRNLPIQGYVLYSRFGRLNAAPMEDISRERRILRARNELVACHRAFVDPSYEYTPPHFMQNPRNCNSNNCKFRKDRCKEQTEVLGLNPETSAQDSTAVGGRWEGMDVELVARAWAYWHHFTRLIEMERWAQNAGLGAIFQPGRLGQRLNNHRAMTGARITHVDLEKNTIRFEGRGAQIFSTNGSVLAHRGDLQTSHILQGRVVDASPKHVTLKSQGAPIAATLETEHWILDVLPVRMGVRKAKRALYKVMKRRVPERLQTLLDPTHPDVQARFSAPGTFDEHAPDMLADVPLASINNAGPRLNDVQSRALHLAVHAPGGALIQGPPGTGKTTVIAQIVRELVLRGKRVLVTAQTNTAVDTILSKVLDAGVRTFLRVGPRRKSEELCAKLEAAGADPSLYFTEEVARKAPDLTNLANYLRTCPVYGSTTHSAIGTPAFDFLQDMLGPEPFDVVIVDEASQLTEPMTVGAINMAARFVLVGDHKQLPPIVQSEQALSAYFDHTLQHPDEDDGRHIDILHHEGATPTRSPTFDLDDGLRQIGVAGYDRSLFERLIRVLPHVMLQEQYRMHEDIMAFSNASYYQDRLKAHADVATQTLNFAPDLLPGLAAHLQPIIDPSHALTFVDVRGRDSGRVNEAEAHALIETLLVLLDEDTFVGETPSIGVISPFRAQVQLIRGLLRSHDPELAKRVDVDTVERYQGGERDILLVSLVKTERAGDFLSDARRLNVTLTRARAQLYLFGHRGGLGLNPTFRALIDQPQTHLVTWAPDRKVDPLPNGF